MFQDRYDARSPQNEIAQYHLPHSAVHIDRMNTTPHVTRTVAQALLLLFKFAAQVVY